ncbi:MAG: ABC transporter substrate-binding protein [Acidobacteriota bacterium]
MIACIIVLALFGCGPTQQAPEIDDVLALEWDAIVEQARGSRVVFGMWTGDPLINDYVQGWVADHLRETYDIELEVVSAQGNEIVNLLLTELEGGKAVSEIDFVWINGETFYQLRQIEALAGPFTDKLPNAALVDFDNPFIGYDFQQPIEGFEAPWGNVQLALIYDTERVSEPPRTREALAEWIRANPGRFTWDSQFTGMTFLKSLLIDVAGGPGAFAGSFDPDTYDRARNDLFDWLRDLQPDLWKGGASFPVDVAQLHQLFANDEIDFTMSNNDGEVDNKVMQGILPETSRAYVLDSGTIRNSHYLGLVDRGAHPAGALVAINFLLSPEAQFHKFQPAVWGDGTVLDIDRLPADWQEKFRNVPGRERSPSREAIADRALMEPASEVMLRMYEDFRSELVER